MKPTPNKTPLTLLIDGPVGVGKTALVRALCTELKDLFDMAVIACDHNGERDAEQLRRETQLDAERIIGLRTAGLGAEALLQQATRLRAQFPELDLLLVEAPGAQLDGFAGDTKWDLRLWMIDACAGSELPLKGGTGVLQSDLVLVNKNDIAECAGLNTTALERNLRTGGGARPYFLCSMAKGEGLDDIVHFITERGLLTAGVA